MPRASKANPPSLARTLDEHVDALRKALRQAMRSWDDRAVHQARVTARRLKAAADLLRPVLSRDARKSFSKSLRHIRHTLGPVRDLDVMLAHLESLPVPPRDADARAWLLDQLTKDRTDLRRRTTRRQSARKLLARLDAWVDLEPDVRESQQAGAMLLRRVVPARVRALAECADRLARHPRDQPADTGPGDGGAADAHAVRAAVKSVRHTLDLAGALGCEVPAVALRDFKRIQDALGLWHDYSLLADRVLRAALDARLGTRRPPLYAAVLRLALASSTKAQHHLARFRKLWLTSAPALTASTLAAFDAPSATADTRPTTTPRTAVLRA